MRENHLKKTAKCRSRKVRKDGAGEAISRDQQVFPYAQ
jgi:hypothetical protein